MPTRETRKADHNGPYIRVRRPFLLKFECRTKSTAEGMFMAYSKTPSEVPNAGGLIAEQLAQDALARAMLTYLPAGYERIELEYSAQGPVSQASMWATLTDGTEKSFPDLTDIVRAAETLRASMYHQGSGTWFSMKMNVTEQRSVDVAYNYDDIPWSDFDYAPSAYTADLKEYPRDDDHIPAWLRKQLDADRES
jgi:hypothetical protein